MKIHPVRVVSVGNVVVFDVVMVHLIHHVQRLVQLVVPFCVICIPFSPQVYVIIITVWVDLQIVMMVERIGKARIVEVLDVIFISLVFRDQWLVKLSAHLGIGV